MGPAVGVNCVKRHKIHLYMLLYSTVQINLYSGISAPHLLCYLYCDMQYTYTKALFTRRFQRWKLRHASMYPQCSLPVYTREVDTNLEGWRNSKMEAQYSRRADNSLLLDTYSTSLQRPTKPVRRAKKAAAARRLAIFAANEIRIDVFTRRQYDNGDRSFRFCLRIQKFADIIIVFTVAV